MKECVTPVHTDGQPIRVSITAESTDLYWSTQYPWDSKHSPAPTLQWSSLFLGHHTMASAPQTVVALLSARHSAGNDPPQSWMSHLHREKHKSFILLGARWKWENVKVCVCVCAHACAHMGGEKKDNWCRWKQKCTGDFQNFVYKRKKNKKPNYTWTTTAHKQNTHGNEPVVNVRGSLFGIVARGNFSDTSL